jgi:hypothetical protein
MKFIVGFQGMEEMMLNRNDGAIPICARLIKDKRQWVIDKSNGKMPIYRLYLNR